MSRWMLQRGRMFSREATRTTRRGLPRFQSRASPPHGRVRSHPTRRRRSSATTAVATCPHCVLHVCMLHVASTCRRCVLHVATSSGGPDPRSAECLFVAPHRVLLRAAELNKCSRSETVRCVGAHAASSQASASAGAPRPLRGGDRSAHALRLFIGTCSCCSTTRWSTRKSR